MGLVDVKNELLRDAEREVKKIIAEAEESAKEIKKKADTELQAYKKQAKEHAQQLLQATERKQLAAARFDGQRLLTTTRKRATEAVIAQVKEKIASAADKERKKFLQKLLQKAEQEIKVAVIYVNQKDGKLLTTNAAIKNMPLTGGLIAETADGKIRVNYSVEELIAVAEEQNSGKVSEVLFHA